MAEAKTVATNKFGWVDLSSSDPAAARAFYSKLFGWDAEVIDDRAAGGYGMFKLGGKEVGGVGPLQNPQQPTAWTAYVLVADADAAATKAKAAGGTVLAEPFDVLEEGRMAILADPGGAVFGLWQPKKHTGWEVERVPNSVCWVENDSRNIDAARRFYTDVFGWVAKDSGLPGPGAYTEFQLDGESFAGGMAMPEMVPAEMPSFWITYFAVAEADGVAARAKELGGSVITEPQDIPEIGRFAVIHDPQGAHFGILQPAPQMTGA